MKRHIAKYFSDLPTLGGYLVEADSLLDWLEEQPPPFLLDIREKKDFQAGHIPGSVHSEWSHVQYLIAQDQLPADRRIVVVCYIGVSSAEIAVILRMAGYEAFSLQDGIHGTWSHHHHPLVEPLDELE